VISTYFVRSNDDSEPQPRHFRSHKNSIRTVVVTPTGLPSNDFYYDDDNAEQVIKLAKEKVTFRPTSVVQSFRGFVAPAGYDVADGDIDLKDTNDQDHFAKPSEIQHMVTASKLSALQQRKDRTPKTRQSLALESVHQPEKFVTPKSDVKLSPGNDTAF